MSGYSQEKISEDFKRNKTVVTEKIKLLKRRKPKNLDDQFRDIHDEVFRDIDCLNCANCCKTTSPMLFERDIETLSKHLKIKPGEFVNKYLFLDSDGIYAFKQTPCPFLGSDNYCTVYEHRPKACREYPHTNQRKMRTLLDLALKNAEICPAVIKILERFPV